MPPLCKGRWLAWQDGGGVKVIFFYKTNPHPTPSSSLYLGEPFLFAYDLSIFLTSTAFVDTKAKIRHTSFEIYRISENCPLE